MPAVVLVFAELIFPRFVRARFVSGHKEAAKELGCLVRIVTCNEIRRTNVIGKGELHLRRFGTVPIRFTKNYQNCLASDRKCR